MEVQPNQEPSTNVTELWRVQRVGGIAMNLGTMPYEELMGVYIHAQEHVERAEADIALVSLYLDHRFPLGDGDAA